MQQQLPGVRCNSKNIEDHHANIQPIFESKI